MKILASIGAIALTAVWAALAIHFPVIVAGTAGAAFVISLIYIWNIT